MSEVNRSNYLKNLDEAKESVQQIQSMSEPDVDQLIPLVEKGNNAIKACWSRVEEVDKMLATMNPGDGEQA